MSFSFRGTRGDLKVDFQDLFLKDLQYIFTQLVQLIPIHWLFLSQLWLVAGAFFIATSLRMYATCQQLQAQAQAHAAAARGFLGHTELRLHAPPSMAFAARSRLQGLRLQLALLDHEFDDLDYDALRALDLDNTSSTSSTHSLSEDEINALPVHKHKASGLHNEGSLELDASSSSTSAEWTKVNLSVKAQEDELTCSICLEQVIGGELVRSLPCLHQFHANCIDTWLPTRNMSCV